MRVTETVSADAALQYASRILNDRDRARDVVQETFVELQRRQRWQLLSRSGEMASHGLS